MPAFAEIHVYKNLERLECVHGIRMPPADAKFLYSFQFKNDFLMNKVTLEGMMGYWPLSKLKKTNVT